MHDDDLQRVRADLAVVKGLCAEPAVPREDVGWYLAMAVLGVVLVIAPWLVPLAWIKAGVLLFFAVWAVVFVPRKYRLLKQRQPERAMETKEYLVWSVAAVALVAFVLYSRFILRTDAAYAGELLRREMGAVFVFLGVGLAAGGLVHRTRRPQLALGASMGAAGLLIPFTSGAAQFLALLGSAMAVGCLAAAIGFENLARRQRSEHDGH